MHRSRHKQAETSWNLTICNLPYTTDCKVTEQGMWILESANLESDFGYRRQACESVICKVLLFTARDVT